MLQSPQDRVGEPVRILPASRCSSIPPVTDCTPDGEAESLAAGTPWIQPPLIRARSAEHHSPRRVIFPQVSPHPAGPGHPRVTRSAPSSPADRPKYGAYHFPLEALRTHGPLDEGKERYKLQMKQGSDSRPSDEFGPWHAENHGPGSVRAGSRDTQRPADHAPPSILRQPRRGRSRRPVLVPSESLESVESGTSQCPSLASTSAGSVASAAPSESVQRKVTFDSRVWVFQFERPRDEWIWFTVHEMKSFQMAAMQAIYGYDMQLLPTGTGRTVHRQGQGNKYKVLFTHPALQVDAHGNAPFTQPRPSPQTFRPPALLQTVCAQEVKRILIVDPHDLCSQLLKKAFAILLPHCAGVLVASSSGEALMLTKDRKFDIIVVEERLKIFHRQQTTTSQPSKMNRTANLREMASGSLLMKRLATVGTLMIGMSSHLPQDEQRLREHGNADLVWPKPPPSMDISVLRQVLGTLLMKRSKGHLAQQVFRHMLL